MPLVTLEGNVRDHGLEPLPADLYQRVWLRPNRERIVPGAGALDGQRVYAKDYDPETGAFSIDVWSTLDESLWYTLGSDWLRPGWSADPLNDPSDERMRGYCEWHQDRIFPDAGGPIGDLVKNPPVFGLVWSSPTAPDAGVRTQMQFNTTTKLLYERVIK
jgi:hypothetical protein